MDIPQTPEEIRCLLSFFAQRDDWWVIINPPDVFFNDMGWMRDFRVGLRSGDIGVFISPTDMQIFLIPKSILPLALVLKTFPDMKAATNAPLTKNVIAFDYESLHSLSEWLDLDPGERIQ